MKKKILFGVLAVVGLAVGFNFLLAPQWGRWIRQGTELRSLRKQVAETRRLLAQLPGVEQNRQRLSGQVAIRPTAVPPQERFPELLDRITQLARASHLRLTSLKPTTEISALAPGPSGYLEVPIELTASAGYHPIGAFLDALENSEHLLRVRELEIAADGQDLWNHRTRILLQAYLPPATAGGS